MKSCNTPNAFRTTLAAAMLSLASVATVSNAAVETFTSGTNFFKRVITNTSVQTTQASAFANLPDATTTVFVPPNSAVLVSVTFSAEVACYGGAVNDPNWCEMMVLVNGTEASPKASSTSLGDTFSVATTDNGTASFASWRAHSFSRHTCVRNTTNAPLAVPVAVQWKVVNFSAAAAPVTTFWVDDSAMTVTMSSNCAQS
jgi:hypothetical protein